MERRKEVGKKVLRQSSERWTDERGRESESGKIMLWILETETGSQRGRKGGTVKELRRGGGGRSDKKTKWRGADIREEQKLQRKEKSESLGWFSTVHFLSFFVNRTSVVLHLLSLWSHGYRSQIYRDCVREMIKTFLKILSQGSIKTPLKWWEKWTIRRTHEKYAIYKNETGK